MGITVEPEVSSNIYHEHLDVCQQCRERPFDMCEIGGAALSAQVRMSAARNLGVESHEDSKKDDDLVAMMRDINAHLKVNPQTPPPEIPVEITDFIALLQKVRK